MLSPPAQRGFVIVRTNCSRCHAIGKIGESPLKIAPPFRETAEAIAAARSRGILAVEMEAAALYTFARKRNKTMLCLAQVTNAMGLAGQDFEKGEAQGAEDTLRTLEALARNLK